MQFCNILNTHKIPAQQIRITRITKSKCIFIVTVEWRTLDSQRHVNPPIQISISRIFQKRPHDELYAR